MTWSSPCHLKNTKQKAQAIKPRLFTNFLNTVAETILIEETRTSLFLSSFISAFKSFEAFDANASL